MSLKRVSVFLTDYEIDTSRNSDEIEEYSNGVGRAGLIEFLHPRIHIANDQNQEQRATTLVHEILEALVFALRLKLKERDIEEMERGLYHSLKSVGVEFPEI